MLRKLAMILISIITVLGCKSKTVFPTTTEGDSLDVPGYYSSPKAEMIYSEAILDSFKIFSSIPRNYQKDITKKYPLILMLDANAYFESVVAELKLGTITQGYPASIVVGVGYKNIWILDSLRDRDYTYPLALPVDSFRVSGGAEKFMKFIDTKLLPKLTREYRIDQRKIILMGHSLGGYFVIYYMLNSFDKPEIKITNFIAASPALFYADHYLLKLEKGLFEKKSNIPIEFYSSIGSLERDSTNKENFFQDLNLQFKSQHCNNFEFKMEKYSNFDHMDAAIPGFMKGVNYIFSKDK